jgi:nonsense-mediated mRNA decay protein 3
MCVNCLRNRVDISETIPKSAVLHWCRNCGRWLAPPNRWLPAQLESKELLSLCVKTIRGLNKIQLVDAGFIWTEPHSKRIKVKLTIQKDVFNGTLLQQVFQVEFVVTNQMCEDCHRLMAENTWKSVVQVRQKVAHKRTFFWLEQVILKYGAHMNTVGIKEFPNGLDFYYSQRSHAVKMLEFLTARVPLKYGTSKQLVGQDDNNNTWNYKYTFLAEIAPVSKGDLVCLPAKIAQRMGGISPLVLCYKVTQALHLVDPLTCKVAEVGSDMYWKQPFRSLCSRDNLQRYVVLDTELLGPTFKKFALAEVTVARECDLGANDTQFIVKTHLGNYLQPGDFVLGYDVPSGNYNDATWDAVDKDIVPDVVLVNKCYPERSRRKRHWKMKELNKIKEEDARREEEKRDREREEFYADVEDDPELQAEVLKFREVNYQRIMEERQAQREVRMAEAAAAGEEYVEAPDVNVDDLIEDMGDLAIADPFAGPDGEEEEDEDEAGPPPPE